MPSCIWQSENMTLLSTLLSAIVAVIAVLLSANPHHHLVSPPDVNAQSPASAIGKWALNDDLNRIGKFVAKGHIASAETVFAKDPSNCDSMHATDTRGRVWALAPADSKDQAPQLVAHVGGTLLGGAFDVRGGLYLADAKRGLLYIEPSEPKPAIGRARIVASLAPSETEFALDNGLKQAEIRYTNDIAIDRATGYVYFTDSTRIPPYVFSDGLGQTLLSFGSSHLTGDASGRLLVYIPDTGAVYVLATGIRFANGVGISKDGQHALVASSSSYMIYKVPTVHAGITAGSAPVPIRAEQLERFYNGTLPGLPDGLTVDQQDGTVWVPFFMPVPRILRVADIAPRWLRYILVRAPLSLRPKATVVHSAIAQFSSNGEILRVLHDPKKEFGLLTSVERCKQYLFCGSLEGNHALRFDLAQL